MIKNTGLKYGLTGGAVMVAWLLGLYFFDKNLITQSFFAYWLPLIAFYPVILYLAAGEDYRAGDKRPFQEKIRTPFMAFVVANIFFWLCMYGLHLADSSLSQMELARQLQYAEDQLRQGLGDPEQMNKLRQQVADISAELKGPVKQPAGPYFFSMAIWMILGFGIAAAVTALIRSARR